MNQQDYSEHFEEVIESVSQCRSWKEKRKKLLELGFEFFEDDLAASQEELAEEKAATPETPRQKRLVAYFESTQEPTEDLLNDFLVEKNAKDINYPLFRRYFRKGDAQLKQLLLFGLKQESTSRPLLADFSFFSVFAMDLRTFISVYTQAALDSESLDEFEDIARDFDHMAIEYDYDAYLALLETTNLSQVKKDIIHRLQHEQDTGLSF